jgi:hypothetical protein
MGQMRRELKVLEKRERVELDYWWSEGVACVVAMDKYRGYLLRIK